MLSAQCVRKNLFGCTGKYETAYLKDRYNSEFPVKCSCDPWGKNISEKAKYCYNIIYNSIPYGLPGEKDQVKKLNLHSLRLAFTIEEPEKAKSDPERIPDGLSGKRKTFRTQVYKRPF